MEVLISLAEANALRCLYVHNLTMSSCCNGICVRIPGVCYNCNETGHIQRDCPNADQKTCYNCHGTGHVARDCPDRMEESDTRKCYRCGQTGHISKDCDTSDDACYRCALMSVTLQNNLRTGTS